MSQRFPQNREILVQERNRPDQLRNEFTRTWHGFFEQIYRRFNTVDGTAAIVTADLGAASAGYVQAEQQAQTTLINELKAKVNEIQAALKKFS